MPSYPRFRGGPNDRWELRAPAGKNNNGTARFIYGSYYGTSKKAARVAQEELERKGRAIRGVAEPVRPIVPKAAFERTFEDAAEGWFAWKAPRLEPNGKDNARQILDDYLLPELGPIQLWRFRGEILLEPGDDPDPLLFDLSDFFSDLTGKRGAPLSASTIVQGPARVAKAVFRYAIARNWLDSNPIAAVALPHVPRRPVTAPSPDTLFPFLTWLATYDPELLAAVELLNSGARRVDMAVRWQEWSQERSEITLGARGLILARPDDDDLLPPARGGRRPKRVAMVRETPTSKRRFRTIALDPAANAALTVHWKATAEIALAAGVGKVNPEGFIFSEHPAGLVPRRPDWASHAFLAATRAATRDGLRGLDHVRLYDVRHHVATQLYNAGVPAAVIAERLGNSVQTIEKYYRHAAPARDRDAADVMADLRAQTTAAPARRRAGR